MAAFSMESCLLWIYNRLLPTLLVLGALFGLWCLGQSLERPVYDLWCRWSAQPATDSPVTLVLIDDDSISRLSSRFGAMPWSRPIYLKIFEAIQAQKPAVMVFDGHFTSAKGQDDGRLFEGLTHFPNLISGVTLPEDIAERGTLNTFVPDYYRLNFGVVSIREEADGVIRRLKPFEWLGTSVTTLQGQENGGTAHQGIFPALSVGAAYEFLMKTQPKKRWVLDLASPGSGTLFQILSEQMPSASKTLPLDETLSFHLRWYRVLNAHTAEYARSHVAIPLWRLLDTSQPPGQLAGRIALIGSSSSVFRDAHRTPMAYRHLGPDIHATAIDNILQGQVLRSLHWAWNALLLLILGLGVFGMRLRMRGFGKTLLYTAGGVVLLFWLAFWVLAQQALWMDVVTPALFMLAAFLAGSTFRGVFKEKQLAAMEKSLTQLVDPEVLREIRRMSHVLKPGGEKLEITSMFVDIRNFTTLAERLQPNEVTTLLNAFYEVVVNIVFHHQGTVDKFMGDGILIIFGAPLPNNQHRVLALQAALETLRETTALSRHWKDSQGIDTDIGITLNSGMAFVGFLGPAEQLEYTAVGDTVNTCVRLQEQAKQLRTRLLMSESTLYAPAGFIPPITAADAALQTVLSTDNCVPLGEVTVRGREASIRVFTVRQALE